MTTTTKSDLTFQLNVCHRLRQINSLSKCMRTIRSVCVCRVCVCFQRESLRECFYILVWKFSRQSGQSYRGRYRYRSGNGCIACDCFRRKKNNQIYLTHIWLHCIAHIRHWMPMMHATAIEINRNIVIINVCARVRWNVKVVSKSPLTVSLLTCSYSYYIYYLERWHWASTGRRLRISLPWWTNGNRFSTVRIDCHRRCPIIAIVIRRVLSEKCKKTMRTPKKKKNET